ncbi:ATP-binding cassette domain-containing protein [Natronolimnohabitans sp. A-GB9]|uniref:ATP-binding cassette domain-containing protein n=1 Tax=Natronolimnohabitans sp. A-GB9 TaxID=3069757 RepID=UPI0027B566DD|nr:ATP-binding cassette domain-containing protein [Natronolimnohabitans sp. A-GB9]MDQ2051754.1 ATP-binding cassette domain-containing protein [Natronolimnohabitans sp. A-GB9]
MTAPDPFDFETHSSGKPRSSRANRETDADVGRGDGSTLPLGLTLLAGAVAAVVVVPILWIVVVAFSVDFDRLWSIVFRSRTLEILANTIVLVGVVTTLSVLIGVPLAVLTTLTDLPFRRFWMGALALPLVVPNFTGAFAFISVWGPQGLVQSMLEPFGVSSLPELYGFWGTVFILTLYNYPFVYITTIAGLRAFDKTYLDAARSLENDLRGVFTQVVFPMAKPAIVAGALLAALETAGDFGVPAMLRFDVLTRQIYVEYNALAHDYAAMLSLQLVAITLVILALESQVRDHKRIHGEARGESRSYTLRLGRWTWPALAVCAGVFLLSIVLPVGFLLWWLVRGPEVYVGSLAFEWEYALNSMTVSALAAVIAALLALPVAYLAARYRSVVSGLLERATYVGFAIPGVVIGLSLVFFGSTYLPSLYQTVPLVVFAYVVLYLPLAVGSVRTSVLYVNPRVIEAARSLGSTPLQAFRRITFPMMLPGVAAGAALVFLHGMKELPATLLLRPSGFETLATFIWGAERNAYYGYAAIPALVLIFVSGLAIVAVLSRGDYEYWTRFWTWLRSFVRNGDESGPDDEPIGEPTTPLRSDGSHAVDRAANERTERKPVLELEGVTKAYDGEIAVDDLSLTVQDGELLTLLGPSGCGKTTTLRLIAGFERPDAGTVRIHGRSVADGGNDEFVPSEGRDVGIVFQEFALFPHKTVGENVAYGLHDTSTDEADEVVTDLLDLVGLRQYRRSYPHELSGGQKQRVALARSLAPEPDVLLLDEPLSNLDAGLRIRMRETITSILDSVDVTAVWVTHDQEEALSVGDRTAVLNGGVLEQVDGPRDVFMEPDSRMVAEFLGRTSYLTGHVDGAAIDTPIGRLEDERVTRVDRVRSETVDVLVRPDDVAITPTDENGNADGRIVNRQFMGTVVRYRIALENGDVVWCRHDHEEWYDIDTPVAVSIEATHPLPVFGRSDSSDGL